MTGKRYTVNKNKHWNTGGNTNDYNRHVVVMIFSRRRARARGVAWLERERLGGVRQERVVDVGEAREGALRVVDRASTRCRAARACSHSHMANDFKKLQDRLLELQLNL